MELFLKEKSELSQIVISFIKHLKAAENVSVKYIRCDNAGENIALKNNANNEGLGLTFQMTAPYTPQHNGGIERSFATSYGWMRAMLNSVGIYGKLKQKYGQRLQTSKTTLKIS